MSRLLGIGTYEHYHCHICGKSHPTMRQADECFWEHGELAILRWLAFDVFCDKYFAEQNGTVPEDTPISWEKINKMNELFDFAEEDDCGIWNKVLPGQRI